ncbi:hypothetical protein HRJ45_23490 [Vibrio coralliilyticus]|uniref:hypothetical protein n=1 Tax=Vibrio coralliilyticus TaxID=190893 RepID=UPI001560AFFD|nr:hypothetical protein [Vibrio coralliilyticus]NRF27959.1 hypothetical protein [Vibrio coralliilyticus]NRF82079.1 hypothetical protein [Vibrio coralliilyticus]
MNLTNISFLGLLVLSVNSFAKDYQIDSCVDLQSIGKGENYPGASHSDAWPLDGSYYLINNIDCMDIEFDKIAPEEEFPFNGFLDGNDFTISNVSGKNGIFGYISFAENKRPNISNLKLSDFNIKANRNYVGVLMDYAQNVFLHDIEISNSTVINTGDYTGLVGGYVSVPSSLVATHDIVANQSFVSGGNYTGGVFGRSDGFTNYIYITNLEINGKNYVGGISGSHDVSDYIGHLSSKYSNISGIDYIGGVFGQFGENTADGINVAASDHNLIIGSNYVGGLFGKSSSFSNVYVFSTSNIVSINGDHIGGLYGELDLAYANNTSVYFSGSVSAASTAKNVGRILGSTTGDVMLNKAFYYDGQEWFSSVDNNYGEIPAMYDNFLDISWYLDTLGFSSLNWAFYNPLDVEHGPWMKKE